MEQAMRAMQNATPAQLAAAQAQMANLSPQQVSAAQHRPTLTPNFQLD